MLGAAPRRGIVKTVLARPMVNAVNDIDDINQSGQATSRNRALLGAGLLIGMVVALTTLPINEWLEVASVWIDDHPLPGRVLFVAGAIFLIVLMVPGSIVMLSGGFLFGLKQGVPLVAVSIAIGALAQSFVSRTLVRDWLAAKFENDARFRAIDKAVARKGFMIVFLSRLSLLIPYNLLNLIYGLSGVPLTRMAVATALGMLPAVLLYTYLGSIAGDFDELMAKQSQGDWVNQLVIISGLVMIVVVTYVIHRTATRELKRELGNADDQQD